jgi:hypothetical protein
MHLYSRITSTMVTYAVQIVMIDYFAQSVIFAVNLFDEVREQQYYRHLTLVIPTEKIIFLRI